MMPRATAISREPFLAYLPRRQPSSTRRRWRALAQDIASRSKGHRVEAIQFVPQEGTQDRSVVQTVDSFVPLILEAMRRRSGFTDHGGNREGCSRGRGHFQSLVEVQVESRLLVFFSVFSGRAKAKACAHIDSRSMSSLLRHRHLEELVANNKRPTSVSCQARGRSQERLREKTQTTPSAPDCRGVRSPSTLSAQRCGRYGGLLFAVTERNKLVRDGRSCALG